MRKLMDEIIHVHCFYIALSSSAPEDQMFVLVLSARALLSESTEDSVSDVDK